MAWVLKCERHYTNGTSATLYHKGFTLGIMHECAVAPEGAKQYKTKKEALADRTAYGMRNWEAVKIA